ncbi:MAG TPA: hypothetical protein VHG93_06275 [Longimicrobium sp.]|nr:hypothetical protein [Longimicrobium sp.]
MAGGCVVLACALLAACGDSRGDAPPGREAVGDSPVVQATAKVPPSPSPDVVGRWRGASDQVEFFAGGRVLLRRGEFRGVGRYEFVEPARMLVTWEGALLSSTPGDYAVTLADTTLSLCEADRLARCLRYVRARPGEAPPPAVAGDPGAPRLAEPPRGAQAPPEARMAEAGPMLRQAFTLQETYRMERGAYAPNMDSLREMGWRELPLRHFRQPRVVRADERRFCIVAEPLSGELWPVHIDEQGDLSRGPC